MVPMYEYPKGLAPDVAALLREETRSQDILWLGRPNWRIAWKKGEAGFESPQFTMFFIILFFILCALGEIIGFKEFITYYETHEDSYDFIIPLSGLLVGGIILYVFAAMVLLITRNTVSKIHRTVYAVTSSSVFSIEPINSSFAQEVQERKSLFVRKFSNQEVENRFVVREGIVFRKRNWGDNGDGNEEQGPSYGFEAPLDGQQQFKVGRGFLYLDDLDNAEIAIRTMLSRRAG
jgi:hypothetical protein